MFKTMLSAWQNKQMRDLDSRRVALAETAGAREAEKWATELATHKKTQAAIDSLAPYTPETIGKAPANVIAQVGGANTNAMLQVYERVLSGKQKPQSERATSQEERIIAMSMQDNPAKPTESKYFQMAMALSGRGKKGEEDPEAAETKLRLKALDAVKDTPSWFKAKTPEEKQQVVDDAVRVLRPIAPEQPKKEEKGVKGAERVITAEAGADLFAEARRRLLEKKNKNAQKSRLDTIGATSAEDEIPQY